MIRKVPLTAGSDPLTAAMTTRALFPGAIEGTYGWENRMFVESARAGTAGTRQVAVTAATIRAAGTEREADSKGCSSAKEKGAGEGTPSYCGS
ncbi:hypothetical protein ACIPYQ_00250 [Streptomyces sp. NPDC090045]|uniref:hypothetical protein n=1 Tax=Streptomyces sp. NPDC090045 TaxID=3365927 RepID=UPI00382183F4